MQLPTKEEIETLHRKYAPTNAAYDLVYGHCEIIWQIARQLIDRNKLAVDKNTVEAGCLLHDIGVYDYYDAAGNFDREMDYTQHAVRGQKILETEHFPPIISRLVAHHLGVGLTAQDVKEQKLPIPVQDYVPETIEERLVAYADKFHSKSYPVPTFNSYEWYKNFVAQFGDKKPAVFADMAAEFGIPDLNSLAAKYGYAIRTLESE